MKPSDLSPLVSRIGEDFAKPLRGRALMLRTEPAGAVSAFGFDPLLEADKMSDDRGRPHKDQLRLAIWWLDQSSIEIIRHTGFVKSLPSYLQDAIDDREGRPGRKRLWVPKAVSQLRPVDAMESTDEIEAWDDGWAGIVFWFRDRGKLCFAPGFVTDMKGFIEQPLSNHRLRTLA